MKRVLSCRESVYGSLDDALRMAPDAGIRHLEVSGLKADELEAAKAKIEQAGLQIGTLGTSVKLTDEASVAAYARLVDAAGKQGVDKIFTSIGSDEGAERADLVASLRELARRAADCGVTICMETHPPFGENAANALRTMDDVDSPGLRMNFDTANIYYYNQDIDTVAEFEKVKERVASVHLKDTDGGYHSFNFPVLGQGIVDFPAVFRIAAGVKLSGPFTLELEGPLTSGKTVEERHAAVKASVEYLRSIGAF